MAILRGAGGATPDLQECRSRHAGNEMTGDEPREDQPLAPPWGHFGGVGGVGLCWRVGLESADLGLAAPSSRARGGWAPAVRAVGVNARPPPVKAKGVFVERRTVSRRTSFFSFRASGRGEVRVDPANVSERYGVEGRNGLRWNWPTLGELAGGSVVGFGLVGVQSRGKGGESFASRPCHRVVKRRHGVGEAAPMGSDAT